MIERDGLLIIMMSLREGDVVIMGSLFALLEILKITSKLLVKMAKKEVEKSIKR